MGTGGCGSITQVDPEAGGPTQEHPRHPQYLSLEHPADFRESKKAFQFDLNMSGPANPLCTHSSTCWHFFSSMLQGHPIPGSAAPGDPAHPYRPPATRPWPAHGSDPLLISLWFRCAPQELQSQHWELLGTGQQLEPGTGTSKPGKFGGHLSSLLRDAVAA